MADHHHDTAGPAREVSAQEAFEAARLLAEAYSSNAPTATQYRDIVPTPTNGDTMPYAQPGRAPMSQKATDHASLILAYSFGSLPVGAALSLVLWSLSSVDATTLTIAAATPAVLVGTIGVAARMIGRAVRDGASALPPPSTVHQHTGPTYVHHTAVHQELHTDTRWFGRTVNQLPPDYPNAS
ncbi:hypothetical protein [Streptomyces sp. H39-C1]|uniref:hypothetical protein n=1 Tax=Streptomyces sp. H39-C1 TaxID=3004355 RepID=UPI0022AF7818|nr:hypothetical protein [Streptomyces sp. H39-C1]MCZ4098029.1 hypothetical protein [Streptomyces sp. H39-C1]